MNGKQAKRLRKKARALTKGIKLSPYKRNSETQALETVFDTTRAVYQRLKKKFRET